MAKIDEYLSKRKEASQGGNQQKWQSLEELYSKKLWHPLALTLKDCINDPEFVNGQNLLEIYKCFIHEFEHRINPLVLVQIVLPIATSITDSQESCKFLENIQKTVKNDPEAVILCLTGIADVKLKDKTQNGKCKNIAEVRALLEEAEKKLDGLSGVRSVHGEFHRINSVYLQEVGDFGRYYQEALRYLGCIDLDSVNADNQRYLGFCLCMAALLGENVYNFGELVRDLGHYIWFKEQWIVDLVFAFNCGDIDKFQKMRPQWEDWADLRTKTQFLETKIRLLCLMEMSFARSAKKRQISFDEISARAQIPKEKVESTVMQALSRDLVRGNIDEVHKTVSILWVQPRVLDRKQIGVMGGRMKTWCGDVASVERLVEHEAQEILTK